jgi:hypothetical protein
MVIAGQQNKERVYERVNSVSRSSHRLDSTSSIIASSSMIGTFSSPQQFKFIRLRLVPLVPVLGALPSITHHPSTTLAHTSSLRFADDRDSEKTDGCGATRRTEMRRPLTSESESDYNTRRPTVSFHKESWAKNCVPIITLCCHKPAHSHQVSHE